jgi:hypothetical protein
VFSLPPRDVKEYGRATDMSTWRGESEHQVVTTLAHETSAGEHDDEGTRNLIRMNMRAALNIGVSAVLIMFCTTKPAA